MVGSSSGSKGTNAPVGNVNKSGNNTQIGNQPTPQQQANNARANAISLASAKNRNNDTKASTTSGTFNPKAGEILTAPKPVGPTKSDAGILSPISEPPRNRETNPKAVATPHSILDPTAKPIPNAGSGFGAGRITFDKSGNTKTDNLITAFAGQQAKETFLASQGLGNNATVINEGKFAMADFSGIATYNISGVRGNPNDPALAAFVGPLRAKEQESNAIFESQQAQKSNAPKEISQSGLGAFGKTGNAGQNKLSGDQIYRGSAKEDQIKQTQADKASLFYPESRGLKSDYLTGGTPAKGNVDWVPPIGNHYFNMGQGINNSNVRGSKAESDKLASEESKAASRYFPAGSFVEYGNNKVFTVGGTKYPTPNEFGGVATPQSRGKSYGYSWVNNKLGTVQLVRGSVQEKLPKQQTTASQLIGLTDKNANQEIFRSLAGGQKPVSPQQTNIKSEADLKNTLAKGEKQDAVFLFYSGNKQVGQTSGQRSFRDFLIYEKKYPDLSFQTTYPAKEKALSESVAKNTDFFETLPQSYWNTVSRTGSFSEKNARDINKSFQLNYQTKSRENLASLQGFTPIVSGSGEVASFLKTPFIGQKRSTSLVPSTSWTNVAQFAPGLPIIDKLAGPASEVWVNLLSKGGLKIGEIKTQYGNKVRTQIGNRAREEALNYQKPVQKEVTLRPTNLKELEPVGRQISRQTMGRRPQTELEKMLSESPKVKENPNYEPNRNVFSPKPQPSFDINFKTETPVFRSTEKTSNLPSPAEKAFQERYPLSSLRVSESPLSESRTVPGSSSKSFLTNKSPLPFQKPTPSNSQLSPISREFFGVQFKGEYPKSYLPPASSFTSYSVGKSEGLLPEVANPLGRRGKPAIERTYPQEKNIISRSEFVSSRKFSSEDFLTSSGKKGSANTKSFGALGSFEKTTKIQLLPEETNPLGRRGKPPIKSTGNELILSRAEVVEKTQPRYSNEVFSSKGQKLNKLFGETKAEGVLSKVSGSQKKSKSVIDLEPKKDYQDWRFSNWEKKNPKPEPVGSTRFDSFVSKLPSRNTKSAILSNINFNSKDLKVGFRKTSKNLTEQPKPVKPSGTEFINKGSKSETVLLRKPLQKRRQLSAQEQQYESVYDYHPIPQGRESSGLSSGIMSDLKSGTISMVKFKTESKQSQAQSPMLGFLNKNLSRTKAKTSQNQKPRQANRLFSGQAGKQSPKQITGLFQSPKQGQKPKQIPKLITSQPQQPKQVQRQSPKYDFMQTNRQTTTTIPPKPIIIQRLWGPFGKGSKNKSKSGPTALYNLNVNNIFSSSLSINVKKGRRYEF